MVVTVEDYVNKKLNEGIPAKELAKILGITQSMLTQYKYARGYKASLSVAKNVYAKDGVALHPFSAESLAYEIKKDKRKQNGKI